MSNQFDKSKNLNVVDDADKPTHWGNISITMKDAEGNDVQVSTRDARMPLGGNSEKALSELLIPAYEANNDVVIQATITIRPNQVKKVAENLVLATG